MKHWVDRGWVVALIGSASGLIAVVVGAVLGHRPGQRQDEQRFERERGCPAGNSMKRQSLVAYFLSAVKRLIPLAMRFRGDMWRAYQMQLSGE